MINTLNFNYVRPERRWPPPTIASMPSPGFIDISSSFLKFTFTTLFVLTLVSLGLSIYCHVSKKNSTATNSPIYMLINAFLTGSMVGHGLLFVSNVYLFLTAYEAAARLNVSHPSLVFKNFSTCFIFGYKFTVDLYGYTLILLALFVGFYALLTSESKTKGIHTSSFFVFNFFLLIVYVLVSCTDYFLLFLTYEFLLIPSFVYLFSVAYTRKAIQASLYFVIWTQVGSLLVLIAVVYLSSIVGSSSMYSARIQILTTREAYTIYCLLFVGFGFKIPIWPFHYWLTKTHVEAPSGFSIYLSGFLVKSALYAFFKLSNILCFEVETVFFTAIAFIGSIDASMKMWGQSDLKKLVAYCTVQEMNLILLMFLIGDSTATICGIVFSAAHAFLSSLMFFLVDCLYRRFHTRSVYGLQGVLYSAPNLGVLIILMCVLYAGLPGTVKFSCEFYIFASLAESSWASCTMLIFILNVLGLVGFSKPWFNVVFGLPGGDLPEGTVDLSRRDLYIAGYTFFFFFLITYTSLLSL